MSDDSYQQDADIIRAAYAEKVKEAFKVFAENLGMGQNQKSSVERFVRSLELTRKARDMALEATGGTGAAGDAAAAADGPELTEPIPEELSAEDQALIDQALAGTTGSRAPLHRR